MTRIAVFGAGAIGGYVGGCLASAGASITLIGRARVVEPIARDGIHVSDLDGRDAHARVATATEATGARDADVVLVTVKSAATRDAGTALAATLRPDAVVVSLQNGVRNADALRAALPRHRVLAGMVPFNVVRKGDAFHRGSAGALAIEPGAPAFVAACRAARLAIEERGDMLAVQWAKLVMNLNNAINALANLPLATELAQRDYRRCLAAAQREALALLHTAKLPVAKLTAIPPRAMPALLALPDAVFTRLARRVIAIDPHARSSMWDDLEAGRATEIDYINGEVVALAHRLGRTAPVNTALVGLVRAAETGGRRDFTGPELRARIA